MDKSCLMKLLKTVEKWSHMDDNSVINKIRQFQITLHKQEKYNKVELEERLKQQTKIVTEC